jgi:hypothetical protein
VEIEYGLNFMYWHVTGIEVKGVIPEYYLPSTVSGSSRDPSVVSGILRNRIRLLFSLTWNTWRKTAIIGNDIPRG